jgi:hypothetical protein
VHVKSLTIRSLAIGSIAAIALLGAGGAAATGANAGSPSAGGVSSGGPGGLGTQVPLDSRLAKEYFSYSMPSDAPPSQRIENGVQRLHANYHAIIRAASLAEDDPGVSVDAKRSARLAREDAQRDDQRLVQVAQEGKLDPWGPGYDARLHELWGGSERMSGSGASPAESSLSEVVSLSRTASLDAGALESQARKDSRQQLASFLDGARKTTSANAAKVASAAGSS